LTCPGFFVSKPNKGVRLVTDYAGPYGLNSQILRPIHPFPAAHDIVQAIPPSAKFFATADCVHGYFQLALAEESRDLTTFMLPSGRWQYLQGPIGLSVTSDDWCMQEEQLCHRGQRKCKKDCLQHSLLGSNHMSILNTILMRC
jgi:hypothetical protein